MGIGPALKTGRRPFMFTATISHHSISRARSISAKTLASAKRKATIEFDGEFIDYRIVIYDETGQIVTSRLVSERRWSDRR